MGRSNAKKAAQDPPQDEEQQHEQQEETARPASVSAANELTGEIAVPDEATASSPPADENGIEPFFTFSGTTLTVKAPGVYREFPGSHTTILVAVDESHVLHVPMSADGLAVRRVTIDDFKARYVGTPYPAREAAKRYLAATHLACSDRARRLLAQLVKKESDMSASAAASETRGATRASNARNARALARRQQAEAIAASAARIKQESDAKRAAKKGAAAKAPAKKPVTKTAKPKAAKQSARGFGIGAYIKEQLLAGKESEKIIAAAQAKFPQWSPASPAGHVSWYRARLVEEGKLKPLKK